MLSPLASSFIHDSYSNQDGKGTHSAFLKVQKDMRKFPDGGFCLKCDIKNFFSSINKDVLFSIVQKQLDKRKIFGEKRELIDFLLETIIFDKITENPVFTNNKK